MEVALIAKIGTGVLAVGATGGAGAYYKDELAEMWNSHHVSFIVKVKTAVTDFSGTNRCFSSNASTSTENAYCEIRKLTVDKDKKFTSLSSLNSNSEWKIEKEKNLTQDSFYKLTIDIYRYKSLKEKINHDSTDVLMKLKGENKFATFTIVATLDKKEPKANNTYILAKVKTSATVTDTLDDNTSKCKLSVVVDKKVKCKIYKLKVNSEDSVIDSLSKVTFSTTQEITDVNAAKASNYYLVDFSGETDANNKSNLTNDNLKTFTWSNNGADADTKTTTFELVSSMVGKFDKTSHQNELYLLKNI